MNKAVQNTLYACLVSVALFASGCTQIIDQKAEFSCDFVQNKRDQRVSWKSNLPIKFRVHRDLPAAARESLIKAATQWNIISTKNVIQFVDWDATGTPGKSYSNGVPTIFWLNTWESDRSTEQARTTVVWTGDKIKDADIRINAKDFNFSYATESFSFDKVDFVSLMVHEMGHALGFAHSENRESVMYPLLGKGLDRRMVSELSDIESYTCEYGNEIIKPVVLAAAIAGANPPEEVITGEEEEVITQADEGGLSPANATNASSI